MSEKETQKATPKGKEKGGKPYEPREVPALRWTCCLCGNGGTGNELFGIAVFPMEDVDTAQQWFVHPKCLWDAMVPEVRDSAVLEDLTNMGFRGE